MRRVMKTTGIWLCLLMWILSSVNTVRASSAEEAEGKETAEKIQGDLLLKLDLEKMQKMVDEILGEDCFSVGESLKKLLQGEEALSKETVGSFLQSLFFSGIQQERDLFVKLILLVLAAALLMNFTSVFENGQAGDISFYLIYLLLFTLLADSFFDAGNTLYQTISWMMEFMKTLAPAYFITVAAASGTASAAAFYEGVLLLVWLFQWILLNVILPAVNLYILLCLVNHISREEMLGKLSDLLAVMTGWGLKTLLGTAAGLQIVRSLTAPAMDSLKRSLIGRAASSLPAVGNAVNTVTELVLASAVLVRNCLGIVILIVLLMAGAGPVIHYGILSFVYRFLAAAAQPVSDRRIVECLSTMGEGYGLFLKVLFTAEVLCILTFLIVMAGVRGGGI